MKSIAFPKHAVNYKYRSVISWPVRVRYKVANFSLVINLTMVDL